MALRRRRAPESDAEGSQPPEIQPQDTRDATRSLGAILAELGDRSFGWSIIVFALVNLLPLPFGSNVVTALPLLLLTGQMVLGFSHVRLPGIIARRHVPRRGFQGVVLRFRPLLRRIERIIRPRHVWLFAPRAERIVGACLFLVSVALFLPIPFSGLISAFALLVAGIGLAERDGAVVFAGLAVGVVAIAVTLAAATTIVLGVQAAT